MNGTLVLLLVVERQTKRERERSRGRQLLGSMQAGYWFAEESGPGCKRANTLRRSQVFSADSAVSVFGARLFQNVCHLRLRSLPAASPPLLCFQTPASIVFFSSPLSPPSLYAVCFTMSHSAQAFFSSHIYLFLPNFLHPLHLSASLCPSSHSLPLF